MRLLLPLEEREKNLNSFIQRKEKEAEAARTEAKKL